ncbi:MAG: four helix bundle protein [Planctomycetes bacterium]|uniref:four helix bundle protein n=1 Tax=Candidatus Wunengus californicus TaxID=3367619 RepID=UPI004027B264|nr:four helix bundle protein [Planctomycetota bacterium]MBI4222354.1 four helix bundle protein [Planctomycetota bacterium]
MEKEFLQLNDVQPYKTALKLSNYVWEIVIRWDYFAKDTVGKQFVKAVDSISANIAEGFGRYFKKDKINFYRYRSGSVKESFDWNEKAKIRNLINKDDYQHILGELQKLPKEINQLIKITNNKLAK